VVKQQLSDRHPDAVREVHLLLSEAAKEALLMPADHVRSSLEIIIDDSVQQRLIPRAFAVDELFDDVTRPLFEEMPR
jgi:4,5-dihydroxyphthalate decarboxylase